jgi:CDP-paratose synthetase
MNILVTGANGYLARNLIASFSSHNVFELTRANNNKEFIKQANPDVVVHTICSYGRKGESISEIYDSNLFAGIKLLETVKELDKPVTFINCGTSLDKETNLYSISKTQLVEFGKFISSDNLQFINMNLEHFYGKDAPNNFLSFVVKECLANNNIPLTAGTQCRDFIYIDDVCSAFNTVIDNRNSLQAYENIDVGTGISTPVRIVVELIKYLTDSTSNLGFGEVPLRDGDVAVMKADTSKLTSLGWQQKYTLDKGLLEIT